MGEKLRDYLNQNLFICKISRNSENSALPKQILGIYAKTTISSDRNFMKAIFSKAKKSNKTL